MIRAMGVNMQVNDSTADLGKLEAKLQKAQSIGLDAIEIPVHAMNVFRNGRVDHARLAAYVNLFKRYPFRYTTHAPHELNIFRKRGRSHVEFQLLMAATEVSLAIGAETMVYHPGRFVSEEEFLYPRFWTPLTTDEREELLGIECETLREAGELAKSGNLRIGVENMRPYLDCPDYCYSVSCVALAKQVADIAHPNVGVTLDIGHLYLAQNMYGVDLFNELSMIRDAIVHLHVHDNFGRASYSTEKNQYDLIPLGRGDMHAPIGDGMIPLSVIMSVIQDQFDGVLIHEIRERYESEWGTLRYRFDEAMARHEPAFESTSH